MLVLLASRTMRELQHAEGGTNNSMRSQWEKPMGELRSEIDASGFNVISEEIDTYLIYIIM